MMKAVSQFGKTYEDGPTELSVKWVEWSCPNGFPELPDHRWSKGQFAEVKGKEGKAVFEHVDRLPNVNVYVPPRCASRR